MQISKTTTDESSNKKRIADASGKAEVKAGRIPLWCVFLPFSPLVLIIVLMIRCARRGIKASDPLRKKAVRLSVLACAAATLVLWLPGALISNRYSATGGILWLLGVLAWIYIVFVVSSLIMREIDYRIIAQACAEK